MRALELPQPRSTPFLHAPSFKNPQRPAHRRILPDKLPEELLVKRVRSGDVKAFEALFGRYRQRVIRLVLSILKDSMEAEEVVQDVFLTVFEKIDTFRGEASFSTWIHRIAVNAALLSKRRDKSGAHIPLNEAMPAFDEQGHIAERIANWSERADDPLLQQEALTVIQAAVDRLDEKYQEVFVLRDVEGFSTESTARGLGMGIPAVKTRLHRARLHLRKELAGYFEKV